MTLRSFFLIGIATLAVSCSSIPVVGTLSPQAGQREAHRDIATGHMKLYLAGTIGVYPVGVESGDMSLVKKLPRVDTLPSGCTNPQASAGIEYARAYNREIVRYLRTHRNS